MVDYTSINIIGLLSSSFINSIYIPGIYYYFTQFNKQLAAFSSKPLLFHYLSNSLDKLGIDIKSSKVFYIPLSHNSLIKVSAFLESNSYCYIIYTFYLFIFLNFMKINIFNNK